VVSVLETMVSHMADCFVPAVNEALVFVDVIESQTFPLFSVRVETVISIAPSAID
jgi:hypothetical protein